MSFNTNQSIDGGSRSSDLDQQAQDRLKQLGNKKAISSADIFGAQEQKSDEVL